MLKEIMKEVIKEELLGKKETSKESLSKQFEGKVCMFRTDSAGVHFGTLVEKDRQECLLKNSRRIYSWAKACSLSQLAMEGDKDIENCKIAMIVDEIILDQVIEVIPMTNEAIKILLGAPVWKK